jgi:hypothetical protein
MTDETPSKRPLCFVIGPIGEAGSETRIHADWLLEGIIKPILGDELGYEVKRADEDARPGVITDRLISDIMLADLVVADLTDLNPNVFWELGVRDAVLKDVILLARDGTKLPFDNAPNRAIFVDVKNYTSVQRARAELAASAHAIKASDYRLSNPVTHAVGTYEARTSADPTERLVADVLSRVASLEEENRARKALDDLANAIATGWDSNSLGGMTPRSGGLPRLALLDILMCMRNQLTDPEGNAPMPLQPTTFYDPSSDRGKG